MQRLLGTLALATLVGASALPAAAADFVNDQAGMFSAPTIAQLNDRIGRFNSATGKEVVVVTVPSLGANSLQDAASAAFAQHNVNGVLIFVARDDRRDIIVPDRAGVQAGWFSPDILRSIRTSMEESFRAENYDAGVASAVDGVLGVYREHAGGRSNLAVSPQNVPVSTGRVPATTGRIHISMFWWIIIIVLGFLIVRSIMRASSMPRYGPPGAPGGMPPGGMPPGGYGPGYGYGGGGGNFWSGLLGGLGGAWLGNEMFGNRGGGAIGPADAGTQSITDGGQSAGGWGGDASSGGMQSDAGQADMGGASGGGWSGGGFGGDFGGGGGGDFGGGGGGGDSGGGW